MPDPTPTAFADLLDGNCCVVGLQWGDEGKGKIVDVLTEAADVVVRYCGGANAGHSVKIGEQKFATHLLPVGVFRPGVMNYLGNGVVIDPDVLLGEIDKINAQGVEVSPSNLRISYKAHVVMTYHKTADAARESASEGDAIGTTRRGIGPTYSDKATRSTAIRIADLAAVADSPDGEARLRDKVGRIVAERNTTLAALFDAEPTDAKGTADACVAWGKRLAPFVSDVGRRLQLDREANKRIVYEGAHAVLLDLDHGTFPYVTSSNCSALGLFTGAGVPPQAVQQFIGVLKAYSTRVGGGPFPTELTDAVGDRIRERGREYGTTTGRPRRVGWFDAVAARYASDLCGCTGLTINLLDVLDGLDELQICTGYKLRGETLDYFRADMDTLADVEPIFETLPGWHEDTSTCRSFDDLPKNAQAYIRKISDVCGVPVNLVSVGPERDAILRV
ncbi:MAG: adenylosuccinate synthase [Planctomycetota bacterium]